MRAAPVTLLAALGFSSGCGAEHAPTWLVIQARTGSEIDVASARVEPAASVEKSIVDDGRLIVALRPGTAVRIQADGACTLEIPAQDAREGRTVRRTLEPSISVQGATEHAGFGGSVELLVRAGCPEAERGHVDWTQLAGPELQGVKVSAGGRTWSATLPDLETMLGGEAPWGIVPLSPRTRALVELEAAWRGEDGLHATRKVAIAASPAVSGLPNVPLGARLALGGEGWTLVERPRGSNGALAARHRSASELTIDSSGDYRLKDASGLELEIRAGRYDMTPLDCERSGCHGEIARAVLDSPMAGALARALDRGEPRAACGLACHSVAGAGAGDGGFLEVASELGFDVTEIGHSTWDTLPRDLRRLGGVGCLACHGPGAVPAATARWAILRSDVCATCHDAPPRYGHVAAWRAGAMAAADADVRTRAPACAGCHTTQGFLHAQGALKDARPAPEPAAPLGISCAACHAVHAKEKLSHLVRRVRPSALLGDRAPGTSALCGACHAPEEVGAPGSSAAAIWAARGGVDPQSGAPLESVPVHGGVGCIECHRAGPSELTRGAAHAFRADGSACKRCHAERDARTAQQALEGRARQLWNRIAQARRGAALDAESATPLHASSPAMDATTPLGRAAFDVLLVLEDRAAAIHGPAYARALLDAAERGLAARGARR